jgi:hypothetical protein
MRFRLSTRQMQGCVAILALWGMALIVPEFARVAHPYGSLGFEADNDGVVMSVDGPPASAAGLQSGDCIDLQATALADRLALFGSLGGMAYVRPGLEVRLAVAPGSCEQVAERATLRVLTAREQPMTLANRVVLLADQLLGVLFILLAAALVWQRPSRMTWGFFLYAIWFNPGQIFVSYAELQRHVWLLVPQQMLQALAQAVGYAGFVSFALRFPHDRVDERWQPLERLLPGLVVLLLALQLASFGTDLGWRTEAASRWSYAAGYAVDIGVLLILRQRARSQPPEDRQRTRWIRWGCGVGLAAFIFADSNMATDAWLPLWDRVCPLPIGGLICDGRMPSETFLLCCFMLNASVAIAVYHAVRHYRVIDVRLALSRGAILLLTSFILAALLALASIPIELLLHESLAGQLFAYVPVVAVLQMSFDTIHERLKIGCDRLFFKRFHHAEERLADAAARIGDATAHDAIDAALVTGCRDALALASVAVLHQQPGGRWLPSPHSVGWPTPAVAVPLSDALLQELMQPPQRVWLGESDCDPAMPSGSARPVVALPMASGKALRGVLLCGARRSGDRPAEEEVALMRALALSAGGACERADAIVLREQLRRLQSTV